MFWPHTKTLNASDKHWKSKTANSKIFVFAQDNFLRLDTTSFLLKAQYEPLIKIKKSLNCEAQSVPYYFVLHIITAPLSEKLQKTLTSEAQNQQILT